MKKLYICSILCLIILGIASYCLAANPGDVVINEVMYDSKSSTDEEWVELHNTTDSTITLSGWVLIDDSVYPCDGGEGELMIPGGTTIAAGGYLVISKAAIDEITGEVVCTQTTGSFGLANSGDNIALYTAASGGTLIDGSLTVKYPDDAPSNAGYSIEKIDESSGWSGSTVEWDASVNDYGGSEHVRCTPGTTNSVSGGDTTPPMVDVAFATGSVGIDVHFSEAVDETSSENAAHYTLTSGLGVTNASRDGSDSSIVHLTTASQTDGLADTLIVSGVADTAGNNMTTPDSVAFRQGITPISSVQDTSPNGDTSLLEGEMVTISGLVTASFSSYHFYFLENSPGGPWSGILIYDSDHSPTVGDSLTLAGVVEEYFYSCGGRGKTEITPVVHYNLQSTGNSLPDPALVSTGEVSNSSSTAEMYESVLIKLTGVQVVDTFDVYNEWKVANAGEDSLVVGHHSNYSYVPSLGDNLNITGPLNYAHCNYKIDPRDGSDIVLITDQPPQIANVFQLPTYPSSSDTVVISAKVTDTEGGKSIISVYLLYSIDSAPYDSTAMLDDGVPPDQTVGDSIYTAQILPQTDGTLVDYYLRAKDNIGQVTTSPSNAPTTTYSYTVGELPPTVVINELYYDSPGTDVHTFTELKGEPGTSLDGYNLVGVNGADGSAYRTVSLSGHSIPSDGYFVIAQDDGVENYDMITPDVDWQNGPDNVLLTDASGDTVDAVGYGPIDTSSWFFVGEVTPAPDVASGSSLGRYPDGSDTDTNWVDFAIFASPTPGEANEYPSPLALSIHQIQYTTDPSGDSPYKDSIVVTSGIVTAGSGVFNSGGFYLQDGQGAWNGILIYDTDDSVAQGDSVTVTGKVNEYLGKTEIGNVNQLVVHSSGNTVPDPVLTTPGQVDTSEAYEGVLIKVAGVAVADTMDEYGEWKITGAVSDTCIVDDDGQYTYEPRVGDTLDITGIVNYSFGHFKIEPRSDADIIPGGVGVRFSHQSVAPDAFFLFQNYPNPFNPTTLICYTIPALSSHQSAVSLKVYNIQGQLVRTLVDEEQTPGYYSVNWDGRDYLGEEVASGIYFYRLEVMGAKAEMTRKMVLLR